MKNKFRTCLPLCLLYCVFCGVTVRGEQVDQSSAAAQIANIRDAVCLLTEHIEQAEFYCEYRQTNVVSRGQIEDRQSSTVFKYWQKDRKYCRVDSRISQSDGTEIESRIIARPEGYVILTQAEPNQPLAIVAYGGGDEAKGKASTNNSFPHAAIRYLNFSRTADLLKQLDENGNIKLTELSQDDSRGSTISIQSADGTSATLTLDGQSRCVGVKSIMLGSDGQKITRTLKNEFKARHIPSLQTESISAPNGRSKKITVQLLDYSDSPIPIGIFSLDAQGITQGSVWLRRMIMLAAGIVILGCFFLYRKMKKHA